MAHVEGVDVSHHNNVIDWTQVRDAGIAFAFIKATEGGSYVDPMALTNLASCREVGIVPGMYHFYRHDVDPRVQAEHFLRNLGAHHPGDLPPAIDVEAPADGAGHFTYSAARVVKRIGHVVRAVQSALGRAPIIYTYPNAWSTVTGNTHAFADECPLWVASYRAAPPGRVGGWTDHAVWQYTASGVVRGISGVVDRDRLNGDYARSLGLRVGALTKGGTAVLNQDGKVRRAPGVGSPAVAVLLRGTRVLIIDGPERANGRDWWKIEAGGGVIGWSSSKVLNSA